MTPLPPVIREALPFGLRVGVRRAPALLRWAARRPRVDRTALGGGHLQVRRESPLRRQGTAYAPAIQAAKEHNVRRAAALLDGVRVPAGGAFSWHDTVGPPLRARGFVPGPELHDGAFALGGGGGACQVANLVFWLAVHSGMQLTERHRHGYDLFPDDDRDVPFGCGATVFWPTRDLRFRNPLPHDLRLRVRVEGDRLVGEAWLSADPGLRFEIVERDARFERTPAGVYRVNRLLRCSISPDGARVEEPLLQNRARVRYAVSPEDLPCSRS
ncbi:MAG: VanW family protein [Alphaproteobacteria bacterium]|nr:VanW family protein [Alphaproteobacteria bacterium]